MSPGRFVSGSKPPTNRAYHVLLHYNPPTTLCVACLMSRRGSRLLKSRSGGHDVLVACGRLADRQIVRADHAIEGDRAATVSRHANERAFEVVEAVRDIAADHNVDPAAVAIAWLLENTTVTAPVASARNAQQVGPLMEGVTIQLTGEDMATPGPSFRRPRRGRTGSHDRR